jgi:Holliday junction resolvase RusA-like endonuclease
MKSMLVAFHLHRKPRSSNKNVSARFAQAISNAARANYVGGLVSSALYSRIIWFHKYRSPQGDADNIAKRVHDAVKDVVFGDDNVITHTIAVRVDASEGVDIIADPINPAGAVELIQSVSDPAVRDVLYVEIGLQTDSKVYLGPVA